MTVESGYEPTGWESVPRPISQPTPAAQSVHYNSARHGSHVEESPELLRWRADLLMDEMMMGGVDVSAADGNRTFSGVDAPVVQRPQLPSNGGSANGGTNGGTNGGSLATDHGRSPRDGYERNPYENGSRNNGGNGTNGNHSSTNTSVNSSSGNGRPTNGNTSYPKGAPSNGAPSGYQRPAETSRPPETNGGSYPTPSTRTERTDLPSEPRNFETRTGDSPRYTPDSPTVEPRSIGPSRTVRPDARPDTGNNRAYDDEPLRPSPTRPTPPTAPTNGNYESGLTRYGYGEGYSDESNGRDASATQSSVQQSSAQLVRRDDEQRPTFPVMDEPSTMPSMLRTTMDSGPAIPSDKPAINERFYTGDQQPTRREPNIPTPPRETVPPQMATRPPLEPLTPVESTPRPPATPKVTPQPVDKHTQWATGPDKWEYQDFSSDPDAEEEEIPFLAPYPAPERRPVEDSAVRSDPAQFVSAMSVMGNGKKRSTLLPRSTTLDVDTLHREISDLHGEIAMLLPVGNETGERARHLLDKAYSILQSDPMRSAEVEYYMQQVRSIVQRLHQARKWSDLYRQRLHVYLWGWLGLSAVMLIGRFLFQIDIETAVMWIFGVAEDNFLVTNLATFIGTAFAGALGGAIGALYTMRTHARGEHSFFDRKYGLRGLILPFMGLIVGGAGYLIFGLIFALVGIDPSQSLTAAIIPTMAAFAFGFSQESIYGTRS